jgi:site-specific recombinase XerC
MILASCRVVTALPLTDPAARPGLLAGASVGLALGREGGACTASSCRLQLRELPIADVRMLRHTLVTTMLDAGVDLRDVQIAARHADPRTTMRYDRARNNLDRQPN